MKFLSYLRQPVAVEDRPIESLILVNIGEMFQSNHVDVFICPSSLLITHQPEKKVEENPVVNKIMSSVFGKQVISNLPRPVLEET